MNKQIAALIELDEYLKEQRIQYAVIGGIAVQYWGEPRFTQDIDVVIVTEPGNEEEICKKIIRKFRLRLTDGLEFAVKNRILLIYSSDMCPMDISIGFLDYEKNMIDRGVEIEIIPGKYVRICSPEDLIIQKVFAGRARDQEDVKSIVIRMKGKLDIKYIQKWLSEFEEITDRKDFTKSFDLIRNEYYE